MEPIEFSKIINKLDILIIDNYDDVPSEIYNITKNEKIPFNVRNDFLDRFGNFYIIDEDFRKLCSKYSLTIVYNDISFTIDVNLKTSSNEKIDSMSYEHYFKMLKMYQLTIFIHENKTSTKKQNLKRVNNYFFENDIDEEIIYNIKDRYKNVLEMEEKRIEMEEKRIEIENIKKREDDLIMMKNAKKILVLCATDESILLGKYKNILYPNEKDKYDGRFNDIYYCGDELTNVNPHVINCLIDELSTKIHEKFDVVINEHCPFFIYTETGVKQIYDILKDDGTFIGSSNPHIFRELKNNIYEYFKDSPIKHFNRNYVNMKKIL